MLVSGRKYQSIIVAVMFVVVGTTAWAQEAPATTSPEIPRRPISTGTGSPTDPSENVKAVLEAGMKALADLINKETKRSDDLRDAYQKLVQSEMRRVDERSELIQKYDAKINDLQLLFSEKMLKTEASRIDANRASDAAANKEASTLALTSIKEITQQSFTASKEAILKSEGSNDKRFEQLKSEISISFKGMDEKLVLLTNQNNQAAGKDAGTGMILGVVGVVIGLLIAGATLVLTVTKRHSDIAPNLITIELLREMLKSKNGNGNGNV